MIDWQLQTRNLTKILRSSLARFDSVFMIESCMIARAFGDSVCFYCYDQMAFGSSILAEFVTCFSTREIAKLVMTFCFALLLLQFAIYFHMYCVKFCPNFLVNFFAFWLFNMQENAWLIACKRFAHFLAFLSYRIALILLLYVAGFSVMTYPRL